MDTFTGSQVISLSINQVRSDSIELYYYNVKNMHPQHGDFVIAVPQGKSVDSPYFVVFLTPYYRSTLKEACHSATNIKNKENHLKLLTKFQLSMGLYQKLGLL